MLCPTNKMSTISCSSPSSKESRNFEASLYQYNGLKAIETRKLRSYHNKNFISTFYSGKCRRMKMTSSSALTRETDPKKRVVVTGMGVVSVFGNDVHTFYDNLLNGVSGITPLNRFDASEYPVRLAGQIRNFTSQGYVDAEMDLHLDDCWRYCLVAGKKALHEANLSKQVLQSMDGTRVGVVIGTGYGGTTVLSRGVETLLVRKEYEKVSPFCFPYGMNNVGSALLAMDEGFMGPVYSISTACATSNHCFFAAANHIRKGEADVIVAGGTESPVSPLGIGGFSALRALSQRNDEPEKASRPWDRSRDGFVLSEGAGVLVMESLEHAMNRGAKIEAEYLGGAVTCDANHMTTPRADGLAVSKCILNALENAGVAPEEVNYINAHATSTPAGDLVEVAAIKKVFKNTSHMKMNATKSMIGHGLAAAGGMEAIATIKAITTGWLHPTINQYVNQELEPSVTIDTVPNVKKRHQVTVAISNSMGFGGQNSVAVFAPFKP